jgi:hypothetical protein
MWLGATAHPTAEWITRQLMEAYGWKAAPQYVVRDRDAVYGDIFIRRLRAMGIRDRPTAARSPWQNGYAERLIGSIRRECLDCVVVFGERHLRHLLKSYQGYYNEARTHLSLSKDAPVSRGVQAVGRILCLPIGGTANAGRCERGRMTGVLPRFGMTALLGTDKSDGRSAGFAPVRLRNRCEARSWGPSRIALIRGAVPCRCFVGDALR